MWNLKLEKAATCSHLRPLAESGHLRPLAATCRKWPLAATRQKRPLAATLKFLPVIATAEQSKTPSSGIQECVTRRLWGSCLISIALRCSKRNNAGPGSLAKVPVRGRRLRPCLVLAVTGLPEDLLEGLLRAASSMRDTARPTAVRFKNLCCFSCVRTYPIDWWPADGSSTHLTDSRVFLSSKKLLIKKYRHHPYYISASFQHLKCKMHEF